MFGVIPELLLIFVPLKRLCCISLAFCTLCLISLELSDFVKLDISLYSEVFLAEYLSYQEQAEIFYLDSFALVLMNRCIFYWIAKYPGTGIHSVLALFSGISSTSTST